MAYTAADDRYDSMTYRRTGRSGLDLPAISLGPWHNFGDDVPFERQRAILRRAFDLGVTHFDLANNYGPPPGAADSALGPALRPGFPPNRPGPATCRRPRRTASGAQPSTGSPRWTRAWAAWAWTTSTSSTRTASTRRR